MDWAYSVGPEHLHACTCLNERVVFASRSFSRTAMTIIPRWSLISDHWSLVIDQWLVISDQWVAIFDYRSLMISDQWSVISDQWSVFSDLWSVISDQSSSLIIINDHDNWTLIIDYHLLVLTGVNQYHHQSLIIDHWSMLCFTGLILTTSS